MQRVIEYHGKAYKFPATERQWASGAKAMCEWKYADARIGFVMRKAFGGCVCLSTSSVYNKMFYTYHSQQNRQMDTSDWRPPECVIEISVFSLGFCIFFISMLRICIRVWCHVITLHSTVTLPSPLHSHRDPLWLLWIDSRWICDSRHAIIIEWDLGIGYARAYHVLPCNATPQRHAQSLN